MVQNKVARFLWPTMYTLIHDIGCPDFSAQNLVADQVTCEVGVMEFGHNLPPCLESVVVCSAATDLRRGGRFYSILFYSSSQSAKMNELLKSVLVCHVYHRKITWLFLGLTMK